MIRRFWEWLWPPKLKMQVLIHHQLMGESIEGVLVGKSDGHYILEMAKLISNTRSQPVPIGKVMIPMDKVTFIQVLAEDVRL